MITLLPIYVVELLVLISSFMQNVITHSQKKSEKLKVVVSGHQELAAKEKRISEELTKNIYLRRELDKLKQELKNDLYNLEKAHCKLQEQLKEQKKAHQGRSLSSLEYFPLTIFLGL
jgi:small-conductance mechanosensitive channel